MLEWFKDWLKDNPVVILIGLVAALITIAGTFWRWIRFFPPVHRFLGSFVADKTIDSVSPQQPQPEKRWMDCRCCEGSGQYLVKEVGSIKTTVKCPVCRGHGGIFTDCWANPDCRYCSGYGRVISKRVGEIRIYSICTVCSGIGKRPFA